MHNVVVHVLGAVHQIADDLGIRRNDDAEGVLHRAAGGQ